MHRARVSTVAGKKALAEGKWLTVIGNRSVHSGDWVWTDGRCIYGHESAGGSAPVLGKRRESGVPLYVGGWHCIYQRGELRWLSKLPSVSYRGLLYLGAHAAYLLPHPYPRDKRQLLDADMDGYGNIFTLMGVYWVEGDLGIRPSVLGAVRVEKNGKEIASHDLRPYYGVLKNATFTSIITGGGHVDCEGNWGFYLEIDASTDGGYEGRKPGREMTNTVYYVDAEGAHPLFYEYARYNKNGFLRKIENFTGARGKKFPIHDGYYYMWNSYEPVGANALNRPERIILTIFTPAGDKVVTGCFRLGTRFTILRIGEGAYLLGVYHVTIQKLWAISQGWDQNPEEPYPQEWDEVRPFEDGLYLCKDGVMKRLVKGYCDTFRFRRVRDVKTWEMTLKNAIQGGSKSWKTL